jgi:MATE family multidrug resistance protein
MKFQLKETRETLALAFPIMAGQVSQMLMALADTVMVGHVGVVPLAACAFANTVLSFFFISGMGLLSAVSIRVARAHGTDAPHESVEVLRHGLVLAGGSALLMIVLLLSAMPLLAYAGQPPEVVAESRTFFILITLSLLPMFLGVAVKQFAEALARPWPAFWLMFGAVVLNVILNWVMIYGNLGFPALGLEGAGWATLISRVVAAAALLLWVWRGTHLTATLRANWKLPLRWAEIAAQLRLGVPVALHILTEVGAFGVASIMMGWIGAGALAAHQVALSCAATTFMVPLGLAMAVTIRVGRAAAAGQPARVRRIGWEALLLSTGVMSLSAVLFLTAGRSIASGFIADGAVVALAAQLLVVAGFFQLVDGAQVVGAGCLRGLADVHVPMWLGLASYWAVALPLGYALAFHAGLGAIGIWIGLAAGLAVAAFFMWVRFGIKAGCEGKEGACHA